MFSPPAMQRAGCPAVNLKALAVHRGCMDAGGGALTGRAPEEARPREAAKAGKRSCRLSHFSRAYRAGAVSSTQSFS
jgi:hypothetical protein